MIQSPRTAGEPPELETLAELESNAQTATQIYNREKSSASCAFDQIESIVFGGVNSRFWLFRKHMNSTKSQKQEKGEDIVHMPFYAW